MADARQSLLTSRLARVSQRDQGSGVRGRLASGSAATGMRPPVALRPEPPLRLERPLEAMSMDQGGQPKRSFIIAPPRKCSPAFLCLYGNIFTGVQANEPSVLLRRFFC